MMHLLLAVHDKSPVKGFLGALHPGIVHFPIALLAIGALLEILQVFRKKREPAPGSAALAYLAAAAAVPAAFFGFMWADYEGAEGNLIDLHKWLGVASTVFALAAAACAYKSKTSSTALGGLRISLIVGSALVLATGYMGGELVFGEGHLLRFFSEKQPLQKPQDKPDGKPVETPVSDKVDFVKEIAPIIKNMCFKCHGGEKVKGKFKLNTKATAMEGGESGKAINPGKPTLSKFYTSLMDPDENVLMPPPKEKARPSKEQIERVRKWIEQGADWPDGVEFRK
ncbi:MAG TPA: c-type cytochrome domain-containing protein [Planctomycetota bacterium]|nr:c-type cytochrome domain-containing protein [Planctomycetota bacterium]